MLEIKPTRDNVMVVKAAGKITGGDVERIVADTETKLAEFEEVGVVADMTELEGMTAEALAKDLASQLKFLGDWKRFPKVAVVAERGWFEGLSRTMGAMLPQIEVQTFAPDESEKALAFASSVRPDRIRA